MAGCVSCFIIPLLLFLFHRFIQPLVLRFWNPWENKQVTATAAEAAPEWNGWACPLKRRPQVQEAGDGETSDGRTNDTQECIETEKTDGECCKLKSQ